VSCFCAWHLVSIVTCQRVEFLVGLRAVRIKDTGPLATKPGSICEEQWVEFACWGRGGQGHWGSA
jgi:hypothetical protein